MPILSEIITAALPLRGRGSLHPCLGGHGLLASSCSRSRPGEVVRSLTSACLSVVGRFEGSAERI